MRTVMITLALGVLVLGVPFVASLLLRGGRIDENKADEEIYGRYSDHL